jgi:hypothetical protein
MGVDVGGLVGSQRGGLRPTLINVWAHQKKSGIRVMDGVSEDDTTRVAQTLLASNGERLNNGYCTNELRNHQYD